jgi:hypothetical protein
MLRPGIWTFPPSITRQVLDRGGPACDSFDPPWEGGEFGPDPGLLTARVAYSPRGWRRVRGNRFVPPGEPARSPIFVEWRREGERWVISVFGDEPTYLPHLAGREVSFVEPDTTLPLPTPEAYLTNEPWYVNNQAITFRGHRYVKYGGLRSRGTEQLVRVGHVGRIAVYTTPGQPGDPEWIFFPAGPGLYQTYEGFIPPPCRIGPPRNGGR